jgi:hypothetical protein
MLDVKIILFQEKIMKELMIHLYIIPATIGESAQFVFVADANVAYHLKKV